MALLLNSPIVLTWFFNFASPKASIFFGVSATANKAGVALFTPTSVACADSTIATNKVKSLVENSSVVGAGFLALRRLNILSTLSLFMGYGKLQIIDYGLWMTNIIKHKISYVMCMVALLSSFLGKTALAADSVYIEELTTSEIRKKIDAGTTIVIIPTGGSEQNGNHMAIGKHNIIVHYTAGEIAKKLGNTLVAPVIAYVPEGNIEPPEGHMQFAGTISLREETYSALLEDTAASLKQHGFKIICFIGEHGASQNVQKNLADKLSKQWQKSAVQVLQISDYYGNNGQDAWVESLKLSLKNPSAHAGFEDTSELMALDENAVRKNLLGDHSNNNSPINGVSGDSTLASAQSGRYLLNLKIAAAVSQIQHATTK